VAFRTRSLLSAAMMLGISLGTFAAGKPADPFDYNFCGGERVFPIVGAEFSTVCGPRNMVALGRRGKIMWFFPSSDGKPEHSRKGQYRLNDAQLLKLSMLAEVAQVSPSPKPVAVGVQYKLGINFSGRPYRTMHTGFTEKYLPGTRLLKAILALIPDKPELPECSGLPRIFDPIKTRIEREHEHRVSRKVR
jgi:hypothetical protein